MPQMVRVCPLQKFDLSSQLSFNPNAFLHLIGGHRFSNDGQNAARPSLSGFTTATRLKICSTGATEPCEIGPVTKSPVQKRTAGVLRRIRPCRICIARLLLPGDISLCDSFNWRRHMERTDDYQIINDTAPAIETTLAIRTTEGWRPILM